MPALVAGIHVLVPDTAKTWMAGTKSGHDGGWVIANVCRYKAFPMDRVGGAVAAV
jgi:hypothetical protein